MQGLLRLEILNPNRPVVIWGTEAEAIKLFFLAVNSGVYVKGFLDWQSRRELSKLRFLNKPIVPRERVAELGDDYAVFAPTAAADDVRRRLPNVNVLTPQLQLNPALHTANEVVIYGTAVLGEAAYTLLQDNGIAVASFADTYAERHAGMLHGLAVLSPAQLAAQHPHAAVVVASQYVAEIASTLRAHGFDDGQLYRYGKVESPSDCAITLRLGKQTHNLVTEQLYLLIQESQRKRIVLWGLNEPDLCAAAQLAKLLDVHVAYAVMPDSTAALAGNAVVSFKDKSALLGESADSTRVLAVNGRDELLRFVNDASLDWRMFGYFKFIFLNVNLNRLWDASLGRVHIADDRDEAGIRKLRTHCVGNGRLKVAILGNSTSAVDTVTRLPWPSFLLARAEREGKPLELWCAANAQYTSAQELIRLERDVIPFAPDIVISYSSFCETHGLPEHPFVSDMQQAVFEQLSRDIDKRVCYGVANRLHDNYLYHWLKHERMMAAICREFGAQFHAFLQGTRMSKDAFATEDWELFVNNWGTLDTKAIAKHIEREQAEFAELAALVPQYDWLHDATRLWDGQTGMFYDVCHTSEKGAQYLADYIYDTIFPLTWRGAGGGPSLRS